MKKNLNIFKNGLTTGLFLQLAIGPVFFYIINLTLQKSIYDGLFAVLAVTIVDYFYIILSIFGVGKLLKKDKIKKVFGIISSIFLIIFGTIIIKDVIDNGVSIKSDINTTNLLSSFISVFLLTISNPMTILLNTGIFTSKSIENNYTKTDLYIFGFSFGLATSIFLGLSVIIFSLLKRTIFINLIQILNLTVGLVLIIYGVISLIKLKKK